MRILVLLAIITFIMSVIGSAVSPHVYRWELIVSECTVLCWAITAWLWSEIARDRP